MSAKNLDKHNRWRNKTVAFRVSPEEDAQIETAVELCQYLLDEALISTVPGEAYNVPGKIRISYSNSMENLEKALDRMEQALAALH